MDFQNIDPLCEETSAFRLAFGRHVGWPRLSNLKIQSEWVDLFVDLDKNKVSDYPAASPW